MSFTAVLRSSCASAPPPASASPSSSAAAPPTDAEDDSTVLLRNAGSGYALRVPRARLGELADVRRRVRAGDVQAVGLTDDDVSVDAGARTYRLARHASLGAVLLPGLADRRAVAARAAAVVLGAFAFAALAQAKFLFPCTQGYAAVGWRGDSYCVPDGRVADVTPAACPADICSKRIPVNLSTYAAMLAGAVGGGLGVAATAVYVALVCVGAPFGSSGVSDPVWARGAVVGPTGGFFVGFVAAAAIMARCTAAGHDRPRSAYRLAAWLLAAEVACYACGLFWLPFGMAIRRGVSPDAVCPASRGAAACLQNIAK